jgi:Carboxypeptidase regulatory-like domain
MLNASTFILILSAALQARSVPGSLRGRVTDGSGTAVSGAVVAAITERGQVKVGITDTQGGYTIGNLSPGRYTIWAGVSGFSLYENTSLGVRAGRAQTLDICLRPNLGGSSAVRLQMAEVRVRRDAAPGSIRPRTARRPAAATQNLTCEEHSEPFLAEGVIEKSPQSD